MVVGFSILSYLLLGLIVFGWVVKDTGRKDCKGLLALAAPFIIIGYPYFLSKGFYRKH
ncbi:hypothetical protein [Planomicrobium sp. CPCC 101110]|uniref:hypothetical protein n=1 Tax=Planomicrobium sp. CPCC 101110 TaxID=2599619 RepID=UPI00164579D4|nr:hypothetical protein [Planomicrobium sp. CPCC 101110]